MSIHPPVSSLKLTPPVSRGYKVVKMHAVPWNVLRVAEVDVLDSQEGLKIAVLIKLAVVVDRVIFILHHVS